MKTEIVQLNEVLNYIKKSFVGKNDIIDLLGICLIARENAFLLGPPGTAKSAIVKMLSSCIIEGNNFEYLLTRFTEPSEIFGPFDIRKLKDGDLVTNVEGMLPEASMVFLDEIFNANSAILNSLLMALNEKVFRRGKQLINLPALTFVGASNLLPEDEALEALLDRFLIRVRCENVDPELLDQVLLAGWNLEKRRISEKPQITPDSIISMQKESRKIDLHSIQKEYLNLIHSMRNAGVKVSDRRAVKFQNLIAASAYISGRKEAILSDLWVLKFTWDTEEQIDILSGMVNAIIEADVQEEKHPQATKKQKTDPEKLLIEIEGLNAKWNENATSMEERNIIKDKLRYIQAQTRWIQNAEHKTILQEKVDEIWKLMLEMG